MSRILIVEDEESIAELEKDYLELSGFEVEIENNGETGLKRGMEYSYEINAATGAILNHETELDD